MTYEIKYKIDISKDLKRIPKEDKVKIFRVIREKFAHNPRDGKPLKGNYKGLWRHRVGDYRIVYTFNDAELWVLIIDIDHRKDIYKD